MAVVATYQQGPCTVRMHNDGYADASPEEIKARIEHMIEVFTRVGIATTIRRIEAEQAAKAENIKEE